ncbi:MAG: OmpH family outer membrane protein [Gammaproteobacteria bacterium]
MRVSLMACTLLALIAAVPQQAAAADLKIAYVNFSRLLSDAPQAQAASKKLQDEFGPKQRDLMAKQQKLRSLEDKLNRNGDVMSADEQHKLSNQIQDLQRDVSRTQSDLRDDFNARRNEELQHVQNELIQRIRQYAKDQGYDMVVGDGVIYASDAVDITAKVLEHLGGHPSADKDKNKNGNR